MLNLNAPRFVCLVIGIFAVGCDSSGPNYDPAELASYREQFVSAEELPQPISVDELRAALKDGGDSTTKKSVVLIGQVGGIPNPLEQSQPNFPWQPETATFYIVDRDVAAKLAAHLESQGPDHEDCPFCARAIRKSAESMAVVNFNGKDGKPIPIDGKALFDLREKKIVVVEGDATMIADEMLVVDARRIYVQR